MGFNYDDAIDSLNENSFQFCKKILWPICGFRALSIDDVRPVDLKERVYQLRDDYLKSAGVAPDREVSNYYSIMEMYFHEFLGCKTGSRAYAYKERALDILKKCKENGGGSFEDAETRLIVFLSLFRNLSANNHFDDAKNWIIINSTFSVKLEDAELLEKIRTSAYLTPHDMQYEQAVLLSVLADKLPKATIQAKKNHFHLINSIILSMSLQAINAFESEEEEIE